MRIMAPLILYLSVVGLFAIGLPSAYAEKHNFSADDLSSLETAYAAALARLNTLEADENATPLAPQDVEKRLIRLAANITKSREKSAVLAASLMEKQNAYALARKDYDADATLHRQTLSQLVIRARHPRPPPLWKLKHSNEIVHWAATLGAIRPRLEQRMLATQTQLLELAVLQNDIAEQKSLADANARILSLEKQELEALIALKRAQFSKRRTEIAQARAEVEQLAQQTASLRQIIAKIEAFAPLPPTSRSRIPTRKSVPGVNLPNIKSLRSITRPVPGPIVRKFGQMDTTGHAGKGVYIAAPSQAIVAAPIEGVIVFAEDYRSFGKMVIVRISKNQHIVLHGMEYLFVEFGEYVKMGEPLGRIPKHSKENDPLLYLEIRDQNGPIDPTKWLKL